MAGPGAQLQGQVAQWRRGQTGFATANNRALEALEICPVRQGGRSGLGGAHHRAGAMRSDRVLGTHGLQFGGPNRDDRLVVLERAVANQQTQQIPMLTLP